MADDPLTDTDLKDLMNKLHTVGCHYRMIGLHLELTLDEIKTIEQDNSQTNNRLMEVLDRCLQTRSLTWSDVYSALKSPCVKRGALAKTLQLQNGHRIISPKSDCFTCKDLGVHVEKENLEDDECLLEILDLRLQKESPALTWEDIRLAQTIIKPDKIQQISVQGENGNSIRPNEEKYKNCKTFQRPLKEDRIDFSNQVSGKSSESDEKYYTPPEEHSMNTTILLTKPDTERENTHTSKDHERVTVSDGDCFHSNNLSDSDLSETEKGELKRIFERFCGTICLAMIKENQDPVRIAALLQEEDLITMPKMTELLTSDENKQQRALILYKALEMTIESRPKEIFTTIKVFLGEEALSAIGRKIWRKIGILCNSVHINNSEAVILSGL